jgi:histidine triad (HIT) family protein
MPEKDCIFCKIIRGEIPCNKAFESDKFLAFNDINPQAPQHVLIIPKKHIPTVLEIKPEDRELIGDLFMVANQLAKDFNIDQTGFRTVFNCNRDAGQAVYHIHLHLLGGRIMGWPPG